MCFSHAYHGGVKGSWGGKSAGEVSGVREASPNHDCALNFLKLPFSHLSKWEPYHVSTEDYSLKVKFHTKVLNLTP